MPTFAIGKRKIGEGCEPFIIAEAGINHNGDMALAKKMILAAKEAGADAVKFQTFNADEFILDKTTTYTYKSQGKEVTEPMIDMFKRTEFSPEQWREIAQYCKDNDVVFMSTPGNVSDLNMLLDIGVPAIKIGSDDFVNIPLIEEFSSHGLPLLLSCGMSTEKEIENALCAAKAGQGNDVVLFLCTSQYPTPSEDINILKLKSISEKFPCVVSGLSDHSIGTTAAVMAVALGARIFEKHFTLDNNLPGPDHWFSENPESLRSWIDAIRNAYVILGNGELKPTAQEEMMKAMCRRSIRAAVPIKAGDILTEKNLYMRRPGDGLDGSFWSDVIGKKAKRDFKQGEAPRLEDLD